MTDQWEPRARQLRHAETEECPPDRYSCEINPSSERYQCIFQQNGRAARAAAPHSTGHVTADAEAAGLRYRLANAWRPPRRGLLSQRPANSYGTITDAESFQWNDYPAV